MEIYYSETHETEKLEFKKSTAEWKDACIDIVAMTNKNGGLLFFGIEDSGRICGLTKSEKTIRDLTNDIKRLIDPPLHLSIVWESID